MSDLIKKRLRAIDLAGIGLVLLLTGTTAFGCLVTLKQDHRKIEAKTQELRDDLARISQLSVTLSKAEADLQNTKTRLAQEEAKLPTNNAMDKFVSEVAHVAETAGLKVNAINPQTLINANNYHVLPVEISGSGSWTTCYKFLTGLREMNRITRLDDLTMQVDIDEQPQTHLGSTAVSAAKVPMCKMSVTISTFTAR